MATIAEARPDLVERLVNPEDAQLSTGSQKKILVRCTNNHSPAHTVPEVVYTQSAKSLCKGQNSCTWCSRTGRSKTVGFLRPDLVSLFVDPSAAWTVSPTSRKDVYIVCDGSFWGNDHVKEFYYYPISQLSKGSSGCPWCRAGGHLQKIRYMTPNMVGRLVNPSDADTATTAEYVSLWCDGGGSHDKTVYSQRVGEILAGGNGCPVCKHGGSLNSLKYVVPDLLPLLSDKNDWSVGSTSARELTITCDGSLFGNNHAPESYKQRAANFARRQIRCPHCRVRGDSSSSIAVKFPRYVPLLVNKQDGLLPGKSNKAISLVCDGTVYGSKHKPAEYTQIINTLTKGQAGCPVCSKAASKTREKINFVLEGIIDHIENLSGAQKMALVLRRHGIKPGSPVGQAILKNDVPGLKEIMADLGSEDKDESELADLVSGGSDEEDFLVPDADVEDSMSDEDLPSVSTKEGFAALEALSEISIGSDESAVRFLVDSAVHRLWQMLYAARDVQAYVREVRERLEECDNEYMCEFLGEFLRQYDEASALEVPERWGFYEPNLMQKHMALLVGERKLVGNWSGTGAGKTASAILSAMVGDREYILVVCPNNTVKGWKDSIEVCDPDAEVLTKTFKPKWSNESGSKWLIVNFDKFSGSEESALKMMQDVKFDMLVIDELHWVKERGGTQVSQRRETLRMVRSEMPDDAFVLGMSATPVVNDLSEGRSLIGLIDGRDPDFDTKPNLNNVQALHENMVRVGFRAIIPPKVGFDGEEFIDVDITHIKDELLVPGISHVTVDAIVAMEFAETIAELAREAKSRGKGVMVYTEYLTGIDEPLTQYLRGEGLRVAHFTGSHEKADIGSLVGNFDVLIGTQAIGTGVDGVQKWADTVVYATLPWTSAQFEQSRARVYRQGSTAETVRVVIPRGVVYLEDDKEWSWTDARWNRIKSKKDLASAAVDGEFPEHVVSSPKEATTAALAMLERMDSNDGE